MRTHVYKYSYCVFSLSKTDVPGIDLRRGRPSSSNNTLEHSSLPMNLTKHSWGVLQTAVRSLLTDMRILYSLNLIKI